MSAAIFGANLLDEVQEESLDQLLSDLRWSLQPQSRCVLGIPELDRLIDLFHDSHITATQTHQEDWASSSPGRNDDSTHNATKQARHKPSIIEIGHSSSSSGKTSLLYHITASSILPKIYKGRASTVVWLDTDISFSATRLHEICISFLNHSDPLITKPEQHSIVLESLKHIHVFPVSSSKQVLTTLDNLDTYLLQSAHSTTVPSKHHSLSRPLSLIILDSATTFYWPDRFDADLARLESIQSPGQLPPDHRTVSITTQVLTRLKSLQAKFECTCIYTTSKPQNTRPSLVATTNNASETPNRPLPGNDDSLALLPWSWAATLSLTLTRIPVAQFASHMSLDECLLDRAKRQEVVDRNRVRVGVSEEWLDVVVREKRVREALGRMDANGAFVVRIGKGVEFE